MYETSADIPTEYQRPSISKAALIAGVDRANFYRSHINPGRISVSVDETGAKYIDFTELVRVFGLEKCLAGVKKITHNSNTPATSEKTQGNTALEQSEHTELFIALQVENAKLKAEMQGLRALSEERYTTIIEQREQLRKHFDELQATRRLLEDKSVKETVNSGLISRIKSFFN